MCPVCRTIKETLFSLPALRVYVCVSVSVCVVDEREEKKKLTQKWVRIEACMCVHPKKIGCPFPFPLLPINSCHPCSPASLRVCSYATVLPFSCSLYFVPCLSFLTRNPSLFVPANQFSCFLLSCVREGKRVHVCVDVCMRRWIRCDGKKIKKTKQKVVIIMIGCIHTHTI